MNPTLYDDFKKFINILKNHRNNQKVIDLREHYFLAPPTLLPLLHYMEQHNITRYIPHENTKNYLEKVLGQQKCTDTTIPLRKLKQFNEFKVQYDLSDENNDYINELTDEIKDLLNYTINWNNVYYLLYETLNNIYKHSKFNNAYILCQKYPKNDITDICLIDDGISIPGSFEESNMKFDNDAESIFDAINGKSSDKEEEGLHGRGLNTSARLTSLGFNGEMLIASREGLCIINNQGARISYIAKDYINGTFITIRINNNKIDKNLIKYYKLRKIEKIK